MRLSPFVLAGLFGLGLTLAACGGTPPASAWPGLNVNDEYAFLASGNQLHAFKLSENINTTKRAWAFPPEANNNTGLFETDPGVSAGLVVVGAEGPTGAFSGELYALDPNTGAKQWCVAFDQKGADRLSGDGCQRVRTLHSSGAADNRPRGGIVITDGVVYVGLSSGMVYALDATNGTEKWAFEAQRDVWAAPAVTADAVYVTSLDHHLYALNRETGKVRWQKDLGSASAGTPVVANGLVYVGVFSNTLYALDTEAGHVQWQVPTTNWVWGGPVLAGDTLYFTDVAGTVFAVAAESGAIRWQQALGHTMRATPAVAGDLLFVGDRDGNLYALNRTDGSINWQQKIKGKLLASPHVVGDKVFVPTLEGENWLVAYTTSGAPAYPSFKP